jgi:hypothetical protein
MELESLPDHRRRTLATDIGGGRRRSVGRTGPRHRPAMPQATVSVTMPDPILLS